MTHPLIPFIRGERVPYLAEYPQSGVTALVLPVRSKTGLATARNGDLAHLDNGIAAIIEDGRMRYAARFLCGGGSKDAVILASARACGGVCERCVDTAAGPCVYRCRNASQVLLYIGSAERWLPRLTNHRTQTPWWPEVAEAEVTRYRSISEACAVETKAIAEEEPLYNKRRTSPDATASRTAARSSHVRPALQDPAALIAARVQAGLSPKRLAEKAGISLSHLCQAEKGRCSLSAEYLQKIADALGKPVNSLQNEAYATQLHQAFARSKPQKPDAGRGQAKHAANAA